MRKIFGYKMLGTLLQSLANSCFKADEQQRNGEKVTACGMSDDDIETLCQDILPNMLNPMMSAEEVKDRLGVSDATLNRMVKRGEIPNGECKKRGHTILEEVGHSSLFKTQERQVKRLLFFCFHFFPIFQTLERMSYDVIVPTITLYI